MIALFLLAAAGASAHAELAAATPVPGSRLSAAPGRLTLSFTEPLDRRLTTLRVLATHGRRRLQADLRFIGQRTVVARLRPRVTAGSYMVEWHSVSALDGHAADGSFGFGVRTRRAVPTTTGAGSSESVLELSLRTLWYVALFYFAGGLLCGLLLSTPEKRIPAGWLFPTAADAHSAAAAWRRTRAAGWAAVGGAALLALLDTRSAGGLNWRSVDSYLLSTAPGLARVTVVAALLLAAATAGRARSLAAAGALAALAGLAVGGHADAVSPRIPAIAADWLHLVAAVVWAGGIAQLGAAWLPGVLRLPGPARRAVMREVLGRFGRIALPAFALVVTAGTADALIELGAVQRLWSTGYGVALLAKTAGVTALALLSYLHALRLRPRLLRAAVGATPAVERRHWRLFGAQPAVVPAVLAGGAALAVVPLPASGAAGPALAASPAPATAPATARRTPLLEPPANSQLAVAEEAGPWIAAAWVERAGGDWAGTVRLLSSAVRPVPARVSILSAGTTPCGVGCLRFRVPAARSSLVLRANLGRRSATGSIPISWQPSGDRTAQRILSAAATATQSLRSLRIAERLSTGTGDTAALTAYRISGRHDYEISYRSAGFGETIGIGPRTWVLQPGGFWQEQTGPPLDTGELMPWLAHRRAIRLLDIAHVGARCIADIALADIRPSGIQIPFWFRLRIDLGAMRVLAMRMIAPAHFMDQRYFAFDRPERVLPPR